MPHRERFEERRVEQAEYRDVDAETEGQRQHGGTGERGRLPQRAN
jgi:hypothetical protein